MFASLSTYEKVRAHPLWTRGVTLGCCIAANFQTEHLKNRGTPNVVQEIKVKTKGKQRTYLKRTAHEFIVLLTFTVMK